MSGLLLDASYAKTAEQVVKHLAAENLLAARLTVERYLGIDDKADGTLSLRRPTDPINIIKGFDLAHAVVCKALDMAGDVRHAAAQCIDNAFLMTCSVINSRLPGSREFGLQLATELSAKGPATILPNLSTNERHRRAHYIDHAKKLIPAVN
jgi:hypothetical protein